jgi:dihydroorotate dehydrogenase electron transfer subunit
MTLCAPNIVRAATPGQFVNIYLNSESKLLPRPISIADADADLDEITLVYAAVGEGTEELAGYEPGTDVEVMGPLGMGYKITPKHKHIILIGGGLGVPPLFFAAKAAKAQGIKATALLGYRNLTYMVNDFKEVADVVYSITDDKGTVLDLVRNITSVVSLDTEDALILSCGPKPMLKAVHEWASSIGTPAQISLEERMGCGFGACVGCTVRTVNGSRKVCKDGPVFDSKDIVW